MAQRRSADTDQSRRNAARGGGQAEDRGREAIRPRDLSKEAWKDIAVRVKDEIREDRVPLASAGVAFYAMLALFPALTALISLYGLVADPEQVRTQVDTFSEVLAGGAGQIISEQAQRIVETEGGALTFGLVASVLGALWAASSGMQGLMQALNLAYDERDSRGMLRRRGIALGLTLLGIAFFAVAVAVVIAIPVVLGFLGLRGPGVWLARILRWPLMAAVLIFVLAIIYRHAPDRDAPGWLWVGWGSVIATVVWVAASIAFSFYVANFGSYNETYGALGAVIVLLLWLFLSAFIVILGAELNAEMEHQTRKDTTTGKPLPMGERDASVADHLGEPRGS